MALTYVNDPVSYAFDFTKKAADGIVREPEFKKDFEETQQKCREFAVTILNSCRNSAEVEMVLDDPGLCKEYEDKKPFRSIFESLKFIFLTFQTLHHLIIRII